MRQTADRQADQTSPQERSLALLKENLTAAQRDQYTRERCFYVVGGDTGNLYRIGTALSFNVEELDRNGVTAARYCFAPSGTGALGDILLAQKVALELFETEALRIANRHGIAPLARGGLHDPNEEPPPRRCRQTWHPIMRR